eukprot:jgi/Botrbrau1/20248/Bobra.31_1s0037.1
MEGNVAGDLYDNDNNRIRFEAYSRLQAAAVAFGESLPIPEIVAVGGQSDGKSSLLEAFLGFRFNVREVEMGTRRPLVVQMVHDPSAREPRCRLQEEDSDVYGPPIVPETAVAEAIKSMTETHLRQTGRTVSSKPIVMRAEYAFCPNLTIIDTPGFILKARKGEADTTPDDILQMVKEQVTPAHRLILFLQQSSVEWCSSVWMHVLQEVDPDFQRTIVVASKFDNRLKEFAERWEVDRYLSAAGYLHPNVKPFFVALPKERTLTSSNEWRRLIQEIDVSVLSHLRNSITGGFDEERFGSRIGFGSLKRYLEEELARRYRDAAPATLSILQERCKAVIQDLADADAQLASVKDIASLRTAAVRYVFGVARHVQQLLQGAVEPDPAQHGFNTDEERRASGCPQWPGVRGEVHPQNEHLRLFGGAAFERCMHEFQQAALVLGIPSVSTEKVANILLAATGQGQAHAEARAAQDIAAAAAKQLIGPLLDAACTRLSSIIRRCYDIAAELQQKNDRTDGSIKAYVAFQASLHTTFSMFINALEVRCREILHHHLDIATSNYALSALASSRAGQEEVKDLFPTEELENLPPHGHEQLVDEIMADRTVEREPLRTSQLTVPETPSPEILYQKKRGRMAKTLREQIARGKQHLIMNEDNGFTRICTQAERLFGGIRENVIKQMAPTTLQASLIQPVTSRVAEELLCQLLALADTEFMSMFAASGTVAMLEARKEALHRRAEGLTTCKNEFAALARCL